MLLYIHIPFCDSKCSYCAFNSYVDKFHLKSAYMDALYKQLVYELKHFDAKEGEIESLFIGGGTPSTASPALYEKIFTLLRPYLQKNCEITTEANPNSATLEWLEGMFALGVNRVSFGVQSFDAHKLKFLNRAHSPKQAIDAINTAHKIGFQNISLDLIYATRGDTKELIENDLSIAFSLPINHLSAYALTIEEGTAFETKPEVAKEILEETTSFFQTIISHGFKQYEISNFGTYQSQHNLGYWQYKDYIGAGAGAVGKKGYTRYYPQSDIEAYIANPLTIPTEDLNTEDIRLEKIFLGFRSIIGVEHSLLTKKELKRAKVLQDEAKITYNEGKFFNKNYLLADEIALFISS